MARAAATARFRGRITGSDKRQRGRCLWRSGLLLAQTEDLRANEAGKARWNAGTITVYDYTSVSLAGYVERLVA